MKRERALVGGLIFSALAMAVLLVANPLRPAQADIVNSGDGFAIMTSGSNVYVSDGETLLIYQIQGNGAKASGLKLVDAKPLAPKNATR